MPLKSINITFTENNQSLDMTRWARLVHWELCKKLKFDHTKKIVYVQPRIQPVKWDAQTPVRFWNTNGTPNLSQMTRRYDSQQKTCRIVDFDVPADHRVKFKESKKKDKYLDLARELKKLWNIKVTVIPVVIGILGTVTKGLIQGLGDLEMRGRVDTIQTTALLKPARILMGK